MGAQHGGHWGLRVWLFVIVMLIAGGAVGQPSGLMLDPGGLVPPPELRPARPVAPAAVGTRQSGAPWKMLVLIYPNSDFTYKDAQGLTQRFTGSLTEAQVQRFERSAASYVELVELWSEGLGEVTVDVHRIARPIDSVTEWISGGQLNYWVDHDDVATELAQYLPSGQYDSVMILCHTGTAPTPSYWGLSWIGPIHCQGRDITYAIVRYNKDSAWDEAYLGEAMVHEWLHGLEGWYRELGYKVPDLHSLVAHGFPDPGGNVPMWRDWYASYMCGKLTEPNGERSGISAGVWAGGTILSTASPLPCQLLAPAENSTHTGAPVLKWAATDADEYRVAVRKAGAQQDTASATTARTSWSPPLNALQNNTTYTWSVQARKGGVWSAQAEVLRFKTGVLVDPGEQRKPDLLIKASSQGATFQGDGEYNETGANQTVQGTTAYTYSFTVLAENDAQVQDTLILSAPVPPAGWTASYLVGGQDRTDQITGAGYSASLAPGSGVELTVTVTGGPHAPDQDLWNLLITGSSSSDPSRADTVKAAVTRAAPRPDILNKLAAEAVYRGGNVYDSTGSQQALWVAVDSGQAASFGFRMENDAAGGDDLTVVATAVAPGWTVGYYDKAGTYLGNMLNSVISGMPSNAWAEMRVDLTPGASVQAGTTQELEIRVTSGDGSARDVCRFVAGKRPFTSGRPDLMARSRVDLPYVGDNLVGGPVAQQTCRSVLTVGDVTTFTLRIENDSDAAEALTLKAGVSTAGWTVRYFDALYGGADITASVRGAGWNSGNLASGSGREVRIEMTAGPSAGPVCALQATLSSPRGATDTVAAAVVRGEADMTGDGEVDWADSRAFIGAWRGYLSGANPGLAFDLSGNGTVDAADAARFAEMLAAGAFGAAP